MRYCTECGEEMPQYSRICPSCLFVEDFSGECRCHLSPMQMLNLMQECLDEVLEIEKLPLFRRVGRSQKLSIREAVATFECVKECLLISFAANSDVMDASILMEDMLYDSVERVNRAERRIRIVVAVLVVSIVAIALLYSLYGRVYLEPQ